MREQLLRIFIFAVPAVASGDDLAQGPYPDLISLVRQTRGGVSSREAARECEQRRQLVAANDDKMTEKEFLTSWNAMPSPVLDDPKKDESTKAFVKMKMDEVYRNEFRALDVDRDGVGSKAEYEAHCVGSFMKLDLNSNGFVDQTEVDKWEQRLVGKLKQPISELEAANKKMNEVANQLKEDLTSPLGKLETSVNKSAVATSTINAAAIDLKTLPQDDRKLSVSACPVGFEDASGSVNVFDSAEREARCDHRNLSSYLRVLGYTPLDSMAGEESPPSSPQSYDINRDGKVDCKDFHDWKKALRELFRLNYRKTDGSDIQLKECPPS